MKVLNYEIFKIHAEFCQTLAHPKRLIIITALEKKALTVGELAKLLNTSLATTSQHLKILKNLDIIDNRREGQRIFYFLNDKNLVYACDKIREIIINLYKKKGKIINKNLNSRNLITE